MRGSLGRLVLVVAVLGALLSSAPARAQETGIPGTAEVPEATPPAAEVATDGDLREADADPLDADDVLLADDVLFGDAADDAFFGVDPVYRDPFEPTNRGIFVFNQRVEKYFLDPISTGYEFLVPEAGRRAIHRAILNLNSTSVLVNDILQLRPKRAAATTVRFVVNTTAGLLGLFDVADRALRLGRHHADFGQTLALAGVPSGPFLILPVFGPSTARNAAGDIADGLFQPYFYLLGPTGLVVVSAGSGISMRDANRDSIEALRETSVDYYAALRGAYFMNREDIIASAR